MKIIEKDGTNYIKVVYESPIEKEGTKEWLFKEMLMSDFINLDVTEDLIKGKTMIGQNTVPIMYMVNAMMVKGEKITEKTPSRIFGFLQKELTDFLV